jgi:hypothetical protein
VRSPRGEARRGHRRRGLNPDLAPPPYSYFLYVLPAPVLVPAAMTRFGIGFTMEMVLIAFAAVWPTLLNTLDGMRGVDQVKLDTSRVLGVSSFGSVLHWPYGARAVERASR